jgi:glyoxylase-like metal-dependent hydrolase (beta-lactamase superfamily II)
MRITHVVETHLHADFVSGHRELAALTGAEIVFGRLARAACPHRAVADGDEIPVGALRLRFWETPGHTPESICVLVVEPPRAEPRAVFTGDTLFIGDAGRPDLVAAAGFSPQDMARELHASLRRLSALPDDCEVFPAHGAGSLCGRSLSSEASSTIGAQRATNPALQPMSEAEFVALMTNDLPAQPRYFAMDARLNREGPALLSGRPAPRELAPEDVERLAASGATVLDVRPSDAYCAAHVRGSIAIGLGGQFASWAGSLLPLDRPVVLVAAAAEQAREAQERLARVGLDDVVGAMTGIEAWAASGRAVARVECLEAAELGRRLAEGPLRVLDVRRPREHAQGHVPGAVSAPLGPGLPQAAGLERSAPIAVICQGGYRSTAALGLLEQHGFERLSNVVGGTSAWVDAGGPLEAAPAASGAPS